MRLHHTASGVFPNLTNRATFFDVVAVNVWGTRRARVLDHVSTQKTRPIGGPHKAYARCVPGRNEATGNRFQLKYGRLLPYKNVSPFVVILRAGRLPVTWADVTLVVDGFFQRGWRARIAWIELTFDTKGVPFYLFSRELCTRARNVREFEDEHGTTLCIGSPRSSRRLKIYRKTYDVVRVEFTLQNRFLRKQGITKPEELAFLRKANLWDQVSFRKVDQAVGRSLPPRIRDPWTWLGHGLPPADLLPSILQKTLREVHVDPAPFIVTSERGHLLRRMQRNLIW